MRRWLFRLFAFAVGAGIVFALWGVLMFTAVALGGGALICEGDNDSCGGPVIALLNRLQPVTSIAALVSCLGGGALLAAKNWNR